MTAILIVLISVMIPIVFLIVSGTQKVKERKCLHLERIKALEMGLNTLPAALAGPEGEQTKKVEKPASEGGGPALHGTVWTAIGLGLLVATIAARAQFTSEGARDFFLVVQVWAIPALFVGVGLIIYSVITGRNRRKSAHRDAATPPALRETHGSPPAVRESR